MKTVLLLLLMVVAIIVFAQKENPYILTGNEYYKQARYDLAEMQYRQALELNPNNLTAKYNLANALMQQKKYNDAIVLYDEITVTAEPTSRSAAFYNAGVGYTKQKDLEKSIEAYKNALRNNPDDRQARENLQKALSELKKQGGGGGNDKNQSNMSQKEAEQKLDQLEQKEKDVRKRLQGQGKGKGTGGSKDW